MDIKEKVLRKYTELTGERLSKDSDRAFSAKAAIDFKQQNGSKLYRLKAYRKGFLTDTLASLGETIEDRAEALTDKTLLAVTNSMGALTYSLGDRLLQDAYVLKKNEYTPNYYFQIIERNGEIRIVDLKNDRLATKDDLINVLKEVGRLDKVPANTGNSKNSCFMEWKDDKTFMVEGEETPLDDIWEVVTRNIKYPIIREAVPTSDYMKKALGCKRVMLRLTIMESEEGLPQILACDAIVHTEGHEKKAVQVDVNSGKLISEVYDENAILASYDWKEICDIAIDYVRNFVALEIAQVFIKITDKGCRIDRAQRIIEMPVDSGADSEIFKVVLNRKDNIINSKIKAQPLRKILYKTCARKGFREYMYNIWLDALQADMHTESTTLKEKIWSWQRGYTSYRIKQYGLTEERAKELLSDYEYAWVNRINDRYRLLINDKLAMRYALDEAKDWMPRYYYFLANRKNGDNRRLFIRALPDLPEGYGEELDDVIRLIREKGQVAYKSNTGTHGDGFCKIEYRDGEYYVNEEISSDAEIREIINNSESDYAISEIIEAHQQFKEIYPNALGTIRVMLINRNGDDPVIEHAYMRIGSSKTGVTDNIGYGGICAYVDVETGRYYGAQKLQNHVFYDCPIHPDTGTKIEGVIPYWEDVKNGILETAMMVPQIEYMGYDIAITEDGFKVIEINTHQDLHKYPEYPESVRNYLKGKCYKKWERYYNNRPYGKRLFHSK